MAHSNPVLVQAVAEQLVAELQAYQRLLDDLRAGGWRTSTSLALAAAADRVQRCSENLPRVAVPFAEFLITRTDLARRVVGAEQGRSEALAKLHAEHVYATNALRRAALQLQAETADRAA